MTHSASGAQGSDRPVAYLINQYPKVSHTFIRREILALERQGIPVVRFALRGWDAEVVDPDDQAEQTHTRYTLANGIGPLLGAACQVALRRPGRFFRALGIALRLSRRSVRPWPYHLIYLGHACRLLGWCQAEGVSHLHAHFGTNPAEIALLLRILEGPSYSFTAHGPDEIDEAKLLGLGPKIAGAAFVAAISSYTRSQLMRHVAPEHWPKIHVIRCGLPKAVFAEIPPPLPDAPVFLCIGRLSAQKGHLVLIEAFAALAATRPEVRLVLAGDGELRSAIEARITALGQGERVRITGWISSDQVRAELVAARIVVQPSLMEGLPVVIMEAMAQYRPVISTYVAGIPELVIPEETGWLVPAGDVVPLTAAMAAALDAPADRLAAIIEAARARVGARHDIDAEAARLAALIAEAGQGIGIGIGPED